MGTGTGGWEALAREVKRSQKQLEAMAFKRAAMRAALKEHRARHGDAYTVEPSRAEFPCFFLCLECGRLVKERRATCPACSEPALVDLSDDDMANLVRSEDVERRTALPKNLPHYLFGGLSLVTVVAAATILFGEVEFDWGLHHSHSLAWYPFQAFFALCLAAIPIALVATPAYLFLREPVARMVRRLRPLPPSRWLLPTRGAKTGLREVGKVEAPDALIAAPITARPCVAYRLRAFLDVAGALSRRQLILDECCAMDFEVDQTVVRGPSVLVEVLDVDEASDVVVKERTVASEGRGDVYKLLRERGLADTDGTVTFVETLVTVGDEIRIETTDTETVIVSTLGDGSQQSAQKGPYR